MSKQFDEDKELISKPEDKEAQADTDTTEDLFEGEDFSAPAEEYEITEDDFEIPTDYDEIQDRKIDEMYALLSDKKMKPLQLLLEESEGFDIKEFLAELPETQMAMVFRMLSKEKGAQVFAEMDSPEQEYIINSINDKELTSILDELYLDDTIDMMEELPANVVKRIMRLATPETRELINQYLRYPENSAGTIMTAEFIDLKKYMTVRESFARIRRIGEDKETIYTCLVTSSDRKLEGIVSVRDLIMSDENEIIENIMDTNIIYATTVTDREDVSAMFSDYNLITIPVVDNEQRLVGIVTVDDVIDVMEKEATEDIQIMAAMSPSDKPYSRTPPLEIWRHRYPWLLLLMLSATFTSIIITKFEDALAAQAVLTAFIPMLMGTGGNSGSQASTAVIRALSLGDVEPGDVLRTFWKELRVAAMCGFTLAIVNFGKMFIIDKFLLGNVGITIGVAAVVSLTVFLVVVFAKSVGCTLPILAEKIGMDPAVMASPIITTVTDAVSLLIYFQIAKIILHLAT